MTYSMFVLGRQRPLCKTIMYIAIFNIDSIWRMQYDGT